MLYRETNWNQTCRFFRDCESGSRTPLHGSWRVEQLDNSGRVQTLRIRVHYVGFENHTREHAFHQMPHAAALVHDEEPGWNVKITQFQ